MDTHPALAVSVDDLLKLLASTRRVSGFWKAGSIGEPVSCDLASARVGDTRKLSFHPKVERHKITGFTKENESDPLLASLDELEALLKKARESAEATNLIFFSTRFTVDGNLVQLRFITESRGRKPGVVVALADAPNRFGFFAMSYAMAQDWREQVRELLTA